MIRTESLKFSYQDNHMNFPNIQLNNGEPLLIIGPSGIGKTTLLHLLAGIQRPESGRIFINEQNISNLDIQSLDEFRGQNIGIVFQKARFIKSLNLIESLLLVQHIGQHKRDPAKCMELLSELNIDQYASSKPQSLSQGEQQRACIAMALINNPAVILADEPTASLDDTNCQSVIELLLKEVKLHESHLVVITHDHRVKAYFDNVLQL
ncbi:MAG: ATP-binding cassette domain-containing protein [Cyclobacteriaceae bacterium]